MSDARRQAREIALQVLYSWEVGRTSPDQAIESVVAAHYPDAAGDVLATAGQIVRGTVAAIADLDRIIGAHSQHWRVERLAVIDRLVLRIAVWELQQPARAPRRVVLNEALELARRFSTEDAVKFVNGVLDAVCRTLDAGSPSPGDDNSNSHVE